MPRAEGPLDERDPVGPDGRLGVTLALIDEINAQDPVDVRQGAARRPKGLVHAERMTHWLGVLAPDATPAQQLAARAAHLRRWALPRSEYPDGRSGYLQWRAEQKRRHADEVRSVLAEAGYDQLTIDRVAAIVAKEHRTADPEVQLHEDALCLTFLELQFADLTDQLGDDHMIDVLRRTMAKMSADGLAAAATVARSGRGAELLARAASIGPGA